MHLRVIGACETYEACCDDLCALNNLQPCITMLCRELFEIGCRSGTTCSARLSST